MQYVWSWYAVNARVFYSLWNYWVLGLLELEKDSWETEDRRGSPAPPSPARCDQQEAYTVWEYCQGSCLAAVRAHGCHVTSWLLQGNIQLQLEVSREKLLSLTSQAEFCQQSHRMLPFSTSSYQRWVWWLQLYEDLVPHLADPGGLATPKHEFTGKYIPVPCTITSKCLWVLLPLLANPGHVQQRKGADTGNPSAVSPSSAALGVAALQPTQPQLPLGEMGWRWAGECCSHAPMGRLHIPGNWPRLGLQMQPHVLRLCCSI